MAAKGTTGAPTSVAEGFQQIAAAATTAMLAPDASPHMKDLAQILGMCVKATQAGHMPPGAGAGPPPGGGMPPGAGPPPGPPGGMPPGAPPGPGGDGGPSGSGISPDDARRLAGQMAATG